MQFPLSAVRHLNDFYGNPDAGGDGLPDRDWEAANLVRIVPPYPMVWSWDLTKPVKALTLHRKCAGQFIQALQEIGEAFTLLERDKLHLARCGGAYNFRLMRGANKLSVHSWGAALDLAPERNPLGKAWDENAGMMPQQVVDIFAKHGIRWGGKWKRPDAMHFEATSI